MPDPQRPTLDDLHERLTKAAEDLNNRSSDILRAVYDLPRSHIPAGLVRMVSDYLQTRTDTTLKAADCAQTAQENIERVVEEKKAAEAAILAAVAQSKTVATELTQLARKIEKQRKQEDA